MASWVRWSGILFEYVGKAIQASDIEAKIEAAVREGLDRWLTTREGSAAAAPLDGASEKIARSTGSRAFETAAKAAVLGAAPLAATVVGESVPDSLPFLTVGVVPHHVVLQAVSEYFKLRLGDSADLATLRDDGTDSVLLRLLALDAIRALRDVSRELPRRTGLLGLKTQQGHLLGHRYSGPVFLLGSDDTFDWKCCGAGKGMFFAVRMNHGALVSSSTAIARSEKDLRRLAEGLVRQRRHIEDTLGRESDVERAARLARWSAGTIRPDGNTFRYSIFGSPGTV